MLAGTIAAFVESKRFLKILYIGLKLRFYMYMYLSYEPFLSVMDAVGWKEDILLDCVDFIYLVCL